MGIAATLTIAISVDGVVRTGSIPRSEGNRISYKETLAQNLTNEEIAGVIDVSALEMLWIKSNKDMVLKTNDGTTPDDTLTLVAGEPQAWASGTDIVCPLGTDVTAFFATTGAAVGDTVLEMEFILDPTP
jgi:hypothetical protein